MKTKPLHLDERGRALCGAKTQTRLTEQADTITCRRCLNALKVLGSAVRVHGVRPTDEEKSNG